MKNFLDNELGAMLGGGLKVLGLGVEVFKGGKRVYNFFGGRRHVEPDKPVTEDTLFRAASLSKIFTAIAIMQLVERGKLSLTDDVSNYLGFELRNPNCPATPITIEMLASHTSSLRDGLIQSLPPQYSLEEFFRPGGVAYEDGAHFAAETGRFFRYANLNYGILGTVIERVTGNRFDVYQRENIFKPLNICGGYVVGNLSDSAFKNLGALYQMDNGRWLAQVDDYATQPRRDSVTIQNPYAPAAYDGTYDLEGYAVGTNATMFSPQGGLRLSFKDLCNCLELLINRGTFRGRQIIGAQSFDTMTASRWLYDDKNPNGNTYGGVMENYGLGTYKLCGTSKARPCKDFAVDLIGHSGEAFGLIAGLYIVPNTCDGFAFMINGTAIAVDDERACGRFSANYIWEEAVTDSVCRYFYRN